VEFCYCRIPERSANRVAVSGLHDVQLAPDCIVRHVIWIMAAEPNVAGLSLLFEDLQSLDCFLGGSFRCVPGLSYRDFMHSGLPFWFFKWPFVIAFALPVPGTNMIFNSGNFQLLFGDGGLLQASCSSLCSAMPNCYSKTKRPGSRRDASFSIWADSNSASQKLTRATITPVRVLPPFVFT
jgi:hypothetical protein